MRSFHGDPAIKEKYLSRVIAHRKADAIIQGTGWENGKGCAVGCTLESYDHSRYPIELGLPKWLAHLEDAIFERLEKEEAKLWPEKFLAAIPVGVCVEDVEHKLAILRMDKLILLQEKNEIDKELKDKIISAIRMIRQCHEAELNKKYCDFNAAGSAAGSAAYYAAYYAAKSAAGSAAGSAARSAAWKSEAEDLLRLLSQCK